ncbi:ribonuclease PH [Dehalococcoidia bacterium]|nr:ribonuclease PH [Dehalococcoidia bacterium]
MRLARFDGRAADELRAVRITPGFQGYAEGSALIELGETRVICAVTVEERVPGFLKGTGSGWVTAEYGMLPRSTQSRIPRDRTGGRGYEIQRLIGRSLRGVVNLDALGERTFVVDCDVLQADGGTRTAAITAAYVSLSQAFQTLRERGELLTSPFRGALAATSVGVVDGVHLLDLSYEEDSHAEVDFNIVMNDAGRFIEVQGTAEGKAFSKSTIDSLLVLAEKGIHELLQIQRAAIERLR